MLYAPFLSSTAVQCVPGNPDNEHLYTNVDQFHMQKDKIDFGGGDSDSDDSVRHELVCSLVCESIPILALRECS